MKKVVIIGSGPTGLITGFSLSEKEANFDAKKLYFIILWKKLPRTCIMVDRHEEDIQRKPFWLTVSWMPLHRCHQTKIGESNHSFNIKGNRAQNKTCAIILWANFPNTRENNKLRRLGKGKTGLFYGGRGGMFFMNHIHSRKHGGDITSNCRTLKLLDRENVIILLKIHLLFLIS